MAAVSDGTPPIADVTREMGVIVRKPSSVPIAPITEEEEVIWEMIESTWRLSMYAPLILSRIRFPESGYERLVVMASLAEETGSTLSSTEMRENGARCTSNRTRRFGAGLMAEQVRQLSLPVCQATPNEHNQGREP